MMDWAEELKMSIRKTTARKGRRSKSRDLLKDTATGSASTSQAAQISASSKPELSIDINLDLPQSSSNSNNITTAAGTSSSSKRPPMLRRISGGWADVGSSNKLKTKNNSFDEDRFGLKSSASRSPIDDIPLIPDYDDSNDDIMLNEIAEPSSFDTDRLTVLNELTTDLLNQNAFSAVEANLSILTKCLQPQETLDEPDEVWEWEKLFTDVVAEIHNDKPLINKPKSAESESDNVPLLSTEDWNILK